MIEWLKQQYNNLIFELFPILPSYLVRDCYKEFDEKYWEFRVMTENRRYDVIYEKEPRGQVVTDNGIPCTARTCCTRLNLAEDKNKQIKHLLYEIRHHLININGYFAFEEARHELGYFEVFQDDTIVLDFDELLKRINKELRE